MPVAMPRSRSVTLVVARGDRVLGATDQFDVSTPWWVDVEEISRSAPGFAVLRLLEGRPAPGSEVGGAVTYLVEALDGEDDSHPFGRLSPWDVPLTRDELRLPWARPGGPAQDLEWAREHVKVTGTPVQHRTWNLSAIWSLPTDRGTAWLKCVPPFLSHEASVLGLLEGAPVPQVLAASGHRMLFEALPGVDGYDAPFDQRAALVDVLIALERSTQSRLEAFLSVGVPDRRWPSLLAAARDVVMRRDPSNRALQRLLDTADERCNRIDECGLPMVLVHGDAHGGNARVGPGAGRGLWFDWGDARIGHPLLDVAVLERPNARHADELMAYWLDAWRQACPGSDPVRAWSLVRPLAALGDAVVYQGFLDGIEASERVYHEGDVLPCLRRAAALGGAGGS